MFVRRPSSFGAVEAAKPEMVDAGLYGGGYGTEGGNLAVVQRRIAWRTSSKQVMSFGVRRVGPG